ncbi:MAG TPA: GtrA family protein [Candidatus Blautia pullistercoris]|uniref:GtrA family protein n=1 Tax=Candidatus Blautia pullistercoris TaxID=2838499 RepID=A0A9D1VN24_9FIRM|nr:GtrA family protein [Candidatus Blautia pullistercoris]
MIGKLYKKYEELVMYIIVGVCTMIVSLASYYILANPLGIYYQTANIISWVLAVAFAYVTNKKFVFKSRYSGLSGTAKEMASFVSSRIASLLAEVISMYFFVQICQIDDNIVKLMNQVLVTVLNYIFSKFWVFRKSRKAQENAGE